MNKRWPAPQIG